MSASPLVSVVVVNYNGAEDIEDCLAALTADVEREPHPSAEVLVVDNASTDGSLGIAEGFAQRSDSIRTLKSQDNRGYAGAVNLALPEARGRYVAVLNMDLVVEPGWLGPLVEFLEAHPDAGAVSPLILLHEDPARINAAGQDVNVTGLGFNKWLGKPRQRAGSDPFAVSGLHGGAFVIRREILERIGGWDDTGFLYAEDVQLSWLVQVSGADIFCVPASTVRHKYELTMSAEKLFLLERNRGYLIRSGMKPLTRAALAPLFAFTGVLMWSYCLLRRNGFPAAKWRTYRWLRDHREQVAQRRALVESIRQRSDWELLRRLRWGYAWDQFLTLGRERDGKRVEPPQGAIRQP